MADLTIEYLDQKLKEQTEGLKVFVQEKVDELAFITSKGFESVEQRMATKKDLAELNIKVDDMDKKIDRLDYKVEEVRDLLIGLDEGPILDLQKRVQVIEKVIKA